MQEHLEARGHKPGVLTCLCPWGIPPCSITSALHHTPSPLDTLPSSKTTPPVLTSTPDTHPAGKGRAQGQLVELE